MQQASAIVHAAGTFLKAQANEGFPDALDLQFGLLGRPVLVGSVFQVAIAALALVVALPDDAEARAIAGREADALLALGTPEGWRYYNLCPEIPPDTDVLAQVLTLLHRLGRVPDLSGPLALLAANRVQPGCYRTWLCATAEEAAAADALWGAAANPVHPEVVANLHGALLALAPSEHDEDARAGAAWVAERAVGGLYPSYWYYGLGYGTYQAMRLFALLSRRGGSGDLAEATACARDAVLATQLSSGGWAATQAPEGLLALGGAHAPEAEAGALETAFMIMALRHLAPDAGVREALGRAEAFLGTCQHPDGGFAAEPFYFTLGPRPLASRALTTAAVLLALSAGLFDRGGV